MKKGIIFAILFILILIWFVINYYIGITGGEDEKLAYQNNTALVETVATNEMSVIPVMADTEISDEPANVDLTTNEQEIFDLINSKRTANGLAPLKIDKDLENIARLKARDMVDKNYFSHQSETYGSPFDMMKNFGISYKTAGENIAGNPSNTGVVTEWMNSEEHKANILNSDYTYTGVAAQNGSPYGKIFVQEFVGR